jgi:hypothetical protein
MTLSSCVVAGGDEGEENIGTAEQEVTAGASLREPEVVSIERSVIGPKWEVYRLPQRRAPSVPVRPPPPRGSPF